MLNPSFIAVGIGCIQRILYLMVFVCFFMGFDFADNIFTLCQWCSNNFPQAKEELDNLYKEVHQLISCSLYTFRSIKATLSLEL